MTALHTSRYERNRIYISAEVQKQLKRFRVLLAGCGIGSMIAECALRMGFENITLVDGDKVELTNLNRQNYGMADIGTSKVEALQKRLLAINPDANITVHNDFITNENLGSLVESHDVAVNALDFDTDIPFRFDELCQSRNIPILHPYNLGWAGLVYLVMPRGSNLRSLSADYRQFEKAAVQYLLEQLENKPHTREWLSRVLSEYASEGGVMSPPQLPTGSYLLAGSCAHLLYKIAVGASVKAFPEFYLFGLEDNV
ncbi:MAG: ThiF family adenylyltransferase [Chitinophagaceae bacterium]